MRQAYLMMVTSKNENGHDHNKYYEMTELPGNRLRARYGRKGATKTVKMYDAGRWDEIYDSKIRKGYKDVTYYHLQSAETAAETAGKRQEYGIIKNTSVRNIVDLMLSWANKAITANYTVTSDQVNKDAVMEVQNLLDSLARYRGISVSEFNDILQKIFTIIPRRMEKVDNYLAAEEKDFAKILAKEQSLLDMVSVKALSVESPDSVPAENIPEGKGKQTVLEANGIDVRECSAEELESVKRHLDPDTLLYFKNAWHVENKKGREKFDAYCKKHGIGENGIKYYYHGSENQNYWSLLVQGMKLHPAQHVNRSGHMFGYGLYFAPKARKSVGYTSLTGSFWANGDSDTAMLMVFKVAMGKPKNVYTSNRTISEWNEEKCRKAGFDSLFAHASPNPSIHAGRLWNDEAVIYNESACTPAYIIELST